jgi:hypothetical protein
LQVYFDSFDIGCAIWKSLRAIRMYQAIVNSPPAMAKIIALYPNIKISTLHQALEQLISWTVDQDRMVRLILRATGRLVAPIRLPPLPVD